MVNWSYMIYSNIFLIIKDIATTMMICFDYLYLKQN